jgi:hypothetical protein
MFPPWGAMTAPGGEMQLAAQRMAVRLIMEILLEIGCLFKRSECDHVPYASVSAKLEAQ